MSIIHSVALAFAMFSRIPMPQLDWNEKNMRYMMCGFPLVGAVIGLTLWGWSLLAGLLAIGPVLLSVGYALIPIAVTGGIHLDGYTDTVDALASHASPEKKREILKDPHTGAFAVIGVGCYLLLYFALCTEAAVTAGFVVKLTLMHVFSRTLCGLAVLLFPPSTQKGLLYTFQSSAYKQRAAAVLWIVLALCAGVLVVCVGFTGFLMAAAGGLAMAYVFFMSRRQFGGMSGDLAGYFLQVCEIAMLAAMVLGKGVFPA